MEILKKAVRGQNRAASPAPESVRVYPSASGAATECGPKPAPEKDGSPAKRDGKTAASLLVATRKPIVYFHHMPILRR